MTMRPLRSLLAPATLLLSFACLAQAPDAATARVERALEAARGNPLRLRELLVAMPKGADLHMHLSGAVYAETFIEDARADGLCIDPAVPQFVAPQFVAAPHAPAAACAPGLLSPDAPFRQQPLYDRLIDSFSLRAFVPTAGWSGHDQFFATFDRFDPTHTAAARHGGEWLDEVATRAAAQNEQYLEIMDTPDLGRAIGLAALIPWPAAPTEHAAFGQDVTGTDEPTLAHMRQQLLARPEFAAALAADRAEFSTALADRRRREQCGTPDAQPACAVDTRFLFQVLRANPPALVFAQTLLAFALADQERREQGTAAEVVGLNFVQPEDNRVAMAEYTRQMRLIGYLHRVYPEVHISLHAGELVEGLVPPQGLRFHIRQAVELAGAERIGHGVDVAHEDQAPELLQTMAHRHIMVEMNLTSNDVILNVAGARQPMALYREAGVPIALSTDDEGVSRIDLTHEFVRAVLEQHLGYTDLRRMVRTSLEHSFLPGVSLWPAGDSFRTMAGPCAGTQSRTTPSPACATMLHGSPRAAAQWELERRLQRFEAAVPAR